MGGCKASNARVCYCIALLWFELVEFLLLGANPIKCAEISRQPDCRPPAVDLSSPSKHRTHEGICG
eukprot:5746837-Alexandrium_andersonii.AAC.1